MRMIYAAIFDSQLSSRRVKDSGWRESMARGPSCRAIFLSRVARFLVASRLTINQEWLKCKVRDRWQPGDAVASNVLMVRTRLQVGVRG